MPVNAANAATVTRSSNVIAGRLEVQVTFDSVADTCWLEAVDPSTSGGSAFTAADRTKLDGIAAQATRNVEQFITQAAYDALSSKDANTTYFITG